MPRRARSELRFETRFALGTLATWRLSRMLAREDGPGDAIVALRAKIDGTVLAGLMDCFYCLTVWVAPPVALAVARRPRDVVLVSVALSGAACLLEQATTRAEPAVTFVPDDPPTTSV